KMIVPSRRTIGAAALIAAGIGAFLVPFLLHSPSPQGTSPTPTGAKDNTSSSITCSPSTIAMGGTSSCTASVPDTTTASNVPTGTASFASSNPGASTRAPGQDKGNGKGNGNDLGIVKNKMDTTVALMKAMGKSNPAFHLHHDTDTDSDEAHGSKSIHNPGDNDSSCAAGEEKHE